MPLLVTLLAVAVRAPVLHVPGALAQVSTHTHGHSSCSLLAVKQGGAVIGTTSLTGVKGSTPAACCAACDANPRCIAFTLSVTSDTEKECWLKDNIKNGTTCPHPTCIRIRDQRPEATPATTAVRELLHGFELPPFTLHVGKRPLWLSAATSSTTWPLQHRQRG